MPPATPPAAGDPSAAPASDPAGAARPWRARLEAQRRDLARAIERGGEDAGLPACERWAEALDELLRGLFQVTVGGQGSAPGDVELAAVGSYGRRAPSYASDIDVRVLVPRRDSERRELIESLLYPLWDSGVSIGHQVVEPDELLELARHDLPTATSLLDWRALAGGTSLGARLVARLHEGVFGEADLGGFLDRLASQTDERHARFGGSVYLLEPDVKNGPGGLRDLDIAHWAARARWGVAGVRDLIRIGVLVPREWQGIERGVSLFHRVRNLLHVLAGRRSDRLGFDRQEQIAIALGHGPGGPGVESFMSEYYRCARAVERGMETVLARAAPPPRRRPSEVRIEGELKITNGAVSIIHPASLDAEPAIALRVYDEAVRRRLPVYQFARDAISRAASLPSFAERLRASPEAARSFVRLCATAQRPRFRSDSVLGELHDVGLLVAMIPEFAPVIGRVHHDLYHVLTVDAHSVACVARLAALCRGELAAEFPLASRLAAELSRPTVLFFACLLHDVGKDLGGRGHAPRGHALAGVILSRLGVAAGDVAEVQHLVLHHLRMYHVATKRDVDDPATLAELCADVHGREGLRELYLLTVCDVSTTSPGAMTTWKARMLDELYVAADRWLEHGASQAERTDLEGRRARVRAVWGRRSRFIDHFLKAMPDRYLYANEPEAVVRHAAFAAEAGEREPAVGVLGSDGTHLEIGFVARDRPGLLALITASLAAARLSVLSAQVHSWVDPRGEPRVLDLFWVRPAGEGGADGLAERLERDLVDLLAGERVATELVEARRRAGGIGERPAPDVTPEVLVDNRASARHTLIEVTARDRLGVLFWLAHTLQEAGLDIALAKINTEGHCVADVFYVSEADGSKLDPARAEEVKARILAVVSGLEVPRGA